MEAHERAAVLIAMANSVNTRERGMPLASPKLPLVWSGWGTVALGFPGWRGFGQARSTGNSAAGL